MTKSADELLAELRRTMLQGASDTDVDRGWHRMIITFETLEEMEAARKALYHALRKRHE